MMIDQEILALSDDDLARIPESFAVEMLNSKRIRGALGTMGANFRTAMLDDDDPDKVIVQGECPDGSTVRIEITKGKDYKSPQEKMRERREKLRKRLESVENR